jgi:hypothetical protein
MNSAIASLLTQLYPRPWRDRYGAEFVAHLEDGSGGIGTTADVLCSAFRERISPTIGGNMEQPVYSFGAVIKRPTAFIPVVMSLAALALVLGRVALVGTGPEVVINGRPDEGTVAHIFQLLIGLQLPVLLFFAVKWLQRAPRQTLGVLALQAGAVMAAMAPVFYFNL